MECESNEERSNNGISTMNSSSSSRWNPTKEQITILENLYMQGIKTPSAEEIQQITARLRVYGHIEGKNVFYWFQNHKARQRQKQKQESFAYFNRFHNTSHPIFPSTPPFSPNAIYTQPCCVPQLQTHHDMLTYYPQNPKVLLPSAGFRRNQHEKVMSNNAMVYTKKNKQQRMNEDCYYNNQETLDLFPLHPTGILEGEKTEQVSCIFSVSADSSTDDTHSGCSSHHHDGINEGHGCHENQMFFDFFKNSAGQGS